MRIRPATSKDEEQVFRLAKALATSFEVRRESFSTSFGEVLASQSSEVIVAEDKTRLVGYVFGLHHHAFYANGLVSWVEEIFVEEASRRKGVGEQLMRAFEHRACERGSRLVALATRRAASFYAAIGYAESATYFRKLLQEAGPASAANGGQARRC